MLSDQAHRNSVWAQARSLNAPYGARCFLTDTRSDLTAIVQSLNAPYGARCFLTALVMRWPVQEMKGVLMHLMALGAF